VLEKTCDGRTHLDVRSRDHGVFGDTVALREADLAGHGIEDEAAQLVAEHRVDHDPDAVLEESAAGFEHAAF
jgi:hypothetical protein